MKRTLASLAAVLFALAAGCTQGTSSRTTIGQSETLPALVYGANALRPATGPSLNGLDRSHWDMPRVRVVPDGSRAWFWRVHQKQRHAGDHPTALTALDAEDTYGLVDLVGIPVRDVLGDGLLLPFRGAMAVVCEHPNERAGRYVRHTSGAWRDAETPAP